MKATLVLALVLAGCAGGGVRHDGGNGGERDALSPGDDGGEPKDAGPDLGPPDGACWMTSPAVACGDGVCDPGCETALDCPSDCPLPMGGIACSGGPTTWACNANASARYECFHGILHIEACGAPGSCHAQPGGYPAQCHDCRPCDGWYMGTGTPYLYTCTSDHTARRRCIDAASGHDCAMGSSATCCAVDDDCAGGACVSRPEGTDDTCPS